MTCFVSRGTISINSVSQSITSYRLSVGETCTLHLLAVLSIPSSFRVMLLSSLGFGLTYITGTLIS